MIAERGSSALVEHLHNKAGRLGIPLSGTFELTPMCSMACRMCYVRMTPEQVRQSGKRLRRTGKGKLTIVPGSNDWWNSSLNIPGRGPGQCERGFVRQRLQVQERREDAAA